MSFSWSTFALQTVNFLVLVWLLKHFLLKPVGAIVARRRLQISHALAEAEAAHQSAEQARKEFELRQSQVATQRQTVLDQARAQLGSEHAKMIEEARAEVEKLRSLALKQIDEERDRAARDVFERAVQISMRLAKRLLQQIAAPHVEELFLYKVLDHLDHLSAAERAALLDQFGHDGGQLIVATANPLDSEGESKWRAALSERVGQGSRIAFTTDKELIAGAELKFPRATLRFSWRDAIADARRELDQT
jgi:F-type H+-transporting ATPase subunit b